MRRIGWLILLIAFAEVVLQVSFGCVVERIWTTWSLYECVRACSSLTWVEPAYVFLCYLAVVWYVWS